MKLGIISDTHVKTIDEIPAAIKSMLAGVDMIIHAGDFTQKAVFDGLQSIGQVKAVCGNMDSVELKNSLPEKYIFEVNGRKIGLTHGFHGSGTPWGIAERVRKQFDSVDIIIFGHSHESYSDYIGGVLMINPGQARRSYGILNIEDSVQVDIIDI